MNKLHYPLINKYMDVPTNIITIKKYSFMKKIFKKFDVKSFSEWGSSKISSVANFEVQKATK